MKTSIVQLRYQMKDVLKALDRREKITVLYHGKAKGTIIPVNHPPTMKVKDHDFFGSRKNEPHTVNETINLLRGGRYNDI